jgi:uncharacterized membrane protein YadS
MTARGKLSGRWIMLGSALLLVVAVLIAAGFGKALAVAGLVAVLVGAGAAITGRAGGRSSPAARSPVRWPPPGSLP